MSAPAAIEMSDDERAIRHLVAQWMDATIAGDNEAVLRMVHDDVVFLAPGQPAMRGKAAFAALQSSLSAMRIDGKADVQDVRVSGDLAYVWNHLRVTITPRTGGARLTREGPALSVLVKREGRWMILRDANMLTVIDH